MRKKNNTQNSYQEVPAELNRTRLRKGFNLRGGVDCKACFQKNIVIDGLREELRLLKARLQGREKAALTEGAFGSSTPSSQIPIKQNSSEENRKKKGGAKPGHEGSGRSALTEAQTEEPVREIAMPEECPDCHVRLHAQGTHERTLVDVTPMKAKRILYHCARGRCPRCARVVIAKPQALPKTLYGNELVAQAATQHYVHGIPIGRILEILGPEVTEGGLIQAFHRFGKLCEKAIPELIERYRGALVKHADETGWRTDGERGYAWIFCSEDTSVFLFQESRSSSVAHKILKPRLNEIRLPGILVVDRYGGYNKIACEIQYCYAHLLRESQKLAEDFPYEREVIGFSDQLSSALAQAMRLRGQKITDEEYFQQARKIQADILELAHAPAKHLGIRSVQRIFTDKQQRLFHWVRNRSVPAENNRAERELRPTVVARKTSFGSQSTQGAKTRSHIMSVLWSVKKRLPADVPVENWLKQALDQIARDPSLELSALMPKIPPPSTPGN